MKKLIPLKILTIIFLEFALYGQNKDFIIATHTNEQAGQFFTNGKPITAPYFEIKNSAKNVFSLENSKVLVVTKNQINAIDLENGEVIYSIYSKASLFVTYDSLYIYIFSEKEFQVYDIETGSLAADIYGVFKCFIKHKNLAIFESPEEKHSFMVHDLNNFEKVSEFNFDREEPIFEALQIGDNTILNWGGLVMLDNNMKSIWSYDQKSRKTYSEKIIMESVATFATAAISPLSLIYIPPLDNNPYQLYKLNSNIISYKDNFYRASLESIDAIDSNGKKIWSTPLGPKYMSTSILFQYNEKLILLNTGTAINNGSKVYHGETCLSTYDIYTGKQLGFNKLQNSFNTKIMEFKVKDNELITIQNDGLSFFNLESGVRFKYKDSKQLKAYNLKYFDNNKFYLDEGKMLLPWNTDSTQLCISYGSGKVLLTDQNLNVIKKQDRSKLCVKLGSYKEGDLMICDNYINLVKNSQKIALLPKGEFNLIQDDHLIIIQDKKIIKISLENLLNTTMN